MGNLLGAPVTDKETHIGQVGDGSIEYGLSSMQGWRVHMEDAHIAEIKVYAQDSEPNGKKIDLPGHSIYAVFDGHGGTFAAFYSGRNFCRVLSIQPTFIAYAKFTTERPEKEATLTESQKAQYLRSGMELLEQALRDAFVELDKEIGDTIRGSVHPRANKPYHEEEKVQATNNNSAGNAQENNDSTDDAVMSASQNAANDHSHALDDDGDSGTTACVVVVTPDWIVCSNAGDSRSVFSKQGHRAVPLSYDHKPDDEDEERRIRGAGGYVAGGRVEGDLAVSRGLGDFRFKLMQVVCAGAHSSDNSQLIMGPGDQKVSSVPDLIVQNRNPEHDEFIIVACDGIWDVVSNPECVNMVAEMFQEGESNLGTVAEEVSLVKG
jgi:serine/threonine protein phosphatase PrpC